MALTTAGPQGSTRRRTRRPRVVVVLVAALVALGLAGHTVGFRLNLDTQPVAVPDARATPEQVVTTYVAAYNRRDFSTMRAIYPSSTPARFGVLGTMDDLAIVTSEALAGPEDGNSAEPGRSYYRVRVTLRFSGLRDSDLAYRNGPNGWAYLLERDGGSESWRIVDHGNP